MGSDQTIAICHIVSGDLWAGAEVQAYTLLNSLRAEPGIDLSVIVLNEGKLAELLKQAGIRVTIVDETKNGFLSILKKVRAELAGQQIDIVHCHRYKENLLGAWLRSRGQVSHLIQTAHGAQEPQGGFKGLKASLYGALNKWASRRFDRIIAVSEDLHHILNDRFDPARIVTIHNAVDLSRVVPQRPSAAVRKELGIGDDQPVIGAIGRMVPVKGFDRFLETAKIILQSRPEALFLLVGDGPLMAEYRSMVRRLGIKSQVRMPGFRDDISDILNCLDLFVMTSHHEGIPIGLLEAMALKIPVAAMSVGGIPEVIEPNLSGVLVESGDLTGLAEACTDLLAHPDRARAIGEAARRRVETEFSTETNRNRVLALYREVVSKK